MPTGTYFTWNGIRTVEAASKTAADLQQSATIGSTVQDLDNNFQRFMLVTNSGKEGVLNASLYGTSVVVRKQLMVFEGITAMGGLSVAGGIRSSGQIYANHGLLVRGGLTIDNLNFTGGAAKSLDVEKQLSVEEGLTVKGGITVQGGISIEFTRVYNTASSSWDKRGGNLCLLYTSPSPRDLSTSRMPSSA